MVVMVVKQSPQVNDVTTSTLVILISLLGCVASMSAVFERQLV